MAIVNHENELQLMIDRYQVGRATTDRSQENLQLLASSLLDEIELQDGKVNSRCKNLAAKLFASQVAVEQIVRTLNSIK